MVQTLQARNVTIRDLIDNSKLELVYDRDFFTEWREHLPELTDPEKQMLDIVQAGFFNLMEYPPYLEKAVQISVLSPLLLLGAFFLHLFQIRAEQSTEVISEDKGMVSQGVIESKVLGKD